MSFKEDFIKAITHRGVRPVPYSVKFTVEARERMRAYLGHDFDPLEYSGGYVVSSHTNDQWTEVKPGYFRDFYGVVWNKTRDRTLGVVEDRMLKSPTWGGYVFPNPDTLPVYRAIEKNVRRYPDHFQMLSIGFTLFERAWSLVGMQELMMYMMLEPAFVHELMERITQYNIGVIRNGAGLGADCVHMGDDWGTQTGPMIGMDLWREFIGPYFARTCRAAKEAGLFVSLHCCGKVDALLEEIVAAGVDVFDPFQPEVMDIWSLREQYRGRLAFWGGLSVQRALPRGSAEDVRRETQRLLREMAPGGGYVLSPSHSLTGDVPPENIEAFLEIAKNQSF